MRHAARRRSLRSAAVLAVAALAAVLLGGCVKIKTGTITQPGKIGALKVEHTVCIVLDTGTSGNCPAAATSSTAEGGAQMLVAYRVPTWAPEPASPVFTFGSTHLSFTRSASYETQLASLLASPGTRWYGYVSAPAPAIPSGSSVQGPLTTTFDLPDTQTAQFSHFTVTGFRLVGSGATADRDVVCGLDIAGGGDAFKAECSSGWWPNTGAGDTSPSDNDQEIFPRNRIVFTAPGATEITSGTSAPVPFKAKGSVAFLAVNNVPLAATTTVPGATATPHASSFSLAGDHDMPVAVAVPAGTPPGDYAVTLRAGSDAGSRSSTATVRVVAPGSGTPGGGGSMPPAGTTPAGTTPAPTTPGGATPGPGGTPPLAATDLRTFESSVASAAATLGGASARADLRNGKLRIKVRASRRGYIEATLKDGSTLLAKGQVAAKRKGLALVKLKLRPAGRTALSGNTAVTGTLTVRFKPRGKPLQKTSVVVTIPAT